MTKSEPWQVDWSSLPFPAQDAWNGWTIVSCWISTSKHENWEDLILDSARCLVNLVLGVCLYSSSHFIKGVGYAV